MEIVDSTEGLAAFKGCGFVPTMGALHEGHLELIRKAVRDGLPPLVSIFVNPTQFGPHEDFSRYPRTLEADVRGCEAAGAVAVFVPTVEMIYPRGLGRAQEEAKLLQLPPVAMRPRLEDACRPTHFSGVCQVVARLFDLCQPQRAYFGEKDFQQLRVITQMVEISRTQAQAARGQAVRTQDESCTPQIVPCPTVRDADGLALSSRNRYLQPHERERALGLSRALRRAQEILQQLQQQVNATDDAATKAIAAAEAAMREELERHQLQIEYAVVRDAGSLEPVQLNAPPRQPPALRALIAARLGAVRLIDNA
ncbi:MAG: pantoate--beta-alanine ligase [Betaproteobacteria bacterium]|nr:pantoate--beta-alanine ligase [Betaproteobacteria bacterium]